MYILHKHLRKFSNKRNVFNFHQVEEGVGATIKIKKVISWKYPPTNIALAATLRSLEILKTHLSNRGGVGQDVPGTETGSIAP